MGPARTVDKAADSRVIGLLAGAYRGDGALPSPAPAVELHGRQDRSPGVPLHGIWPIPNRRRVGIEASNSCAAPHGVTFNSWTTQ